MEGLQIPLRLPADMRASRYLPFMSLCASGLHPVSAVSTAKPTFRSFRKFWP